MEKKEPTDRYSVHKGTNRIALPHVTNEEMLEQDGNGNKTKITEKKPVMIIKVKMKFQHLQVSKRRLKRKKEIQLPIKK